MRYLQRKKNENRRIHLKTYIDIHIYITNELYNVFCLKPVKKYTLVYCGMNQTDFFFILFAEYRFTLFIKR